MTDMEKYMTPKDVRRKGLRCVIRSIEKEIIDGRPRLVMYFERQKKGLVLTRQLAADITAIHGPSRMVEEFFASPEGSEH